MFKKTKATESQEVTTATVHAAGDNRPKRDIIKDRILEGGATREILMSVAGVNKAGLASQLSYLNLIAQGAGTGFPLQDDKGIFYLGTKEEYDAKSANRGIGRKSEPKTPEQILEAARKREDRASSKFANAKKKYDADSTPINELRMEIAEKELKLAGLLLSAAEQGDFSAENVTVSDGTDAVEPSGDEDSMI